MSKPQEGSNQPVEKEIDLAPVMPVYLTVIQGMMARDIHFLSPMNNQDRTSGQLINAVHMTMAVINSLPYLAGEIALREKLSDIQETFTEGGTLDGTSFNS